MTTEIGGRAGAELHCQRFGHTPSDVLLRTDPPRRVCTSCGASWPVVGTGGDADAVRWREIERCARGVVRTAHPDVAEHMVADGWWNALITALGGECDA